MITVPIVLLLIVFYMIASWKTMKAANKPTFLTISGILTVSLAITAFNQMFEKAVKPAVLLQQLLSPFIPFP
ncbi:hypothetical protein [Brevibacillus fulvus]|uniref:Uncharacterized protein n=1 Tax=Brevibacillus fulvus TaxID=1125967 RepID=A0A938Y2M4_9BACL|nr:hypothetical protein [Brevibacillus fulvus]MBM7590095.1 hypothetical protein [Brevibacillus fulvus]